MSMQVSRQNSLEELSINADDAEMINKNGGRPLGKKKVIKKIIKKKNADGTDGGTEVKRIVIG